MLVSSGGAGPTAVFARATTSASLVIRACVSRRGGGLSLVIGHGVSKGFTFPQCLDFVLQVCVEGCLGSKGAHGRNGKQIIDQRHVRLVALGVRMCRCVTA